MYVGIFIAVGVGIGLAIGVAYHQIAMGIAFGAAFGVAAGARIFGVRVKISSAKLYSDPKYRGMPDAGLSAGSRRHRREDCGE
jgi:hypothetical protein